MKGHNLLLGLVLAGALLHLTSFDSYASFLVGFSNGRRIYVENYRVEGEEILLYLKSGLLKVPKREVESISEEKDEPVENEKERIGKPEEEVNDVTSTLGGKTNAIPPIGKKEDVAGYKKKKAEISERLEEAKKNYFEASDSFYKERTRKIMISISRELFALEEEVRKANNGVVPDWWKQ